MAKYRVYVEAHASQVIEVEADSWDEAVELADNEHEVYENISNRFELGDPDMLPEYSYRDGVCLDQIPREDW